MDVNTAPAILAEQLRAQGLTVRDTAQQNSLRVINPFHPRLVEHVGTRDGGYVTDWGYELGEPGDETGTAHRLAFLLGLPSNTCPRDVETRG